MCRKGGRRCPSSNPTGAELEAKNKHRRELYAAKKQQQHVDGLKEQWGGKDAPLVVIPVDATPEDRKKVLDDAEPGNIYVGKKNEPSPDLAEYHQKIQEATDIISEHMYTLQPATWNDVEYDDDINYEYTKSLPEGFTFAGNGVDKVVYYHEGTGLVYKNFLLNEDMFGEGLADAEDVREHEDFIKKYSRREQEMIAEMDDEKLAGMNIRYAKNYFTYNSRTGEPVIAQEYLSKDDYEPYDMKKNPNHKILREMGFNDMHLGNVRQHKQTGEIVLFDCLQVGIDYLEVEFGSLE